MSEFLTGLGVGLGISFLVLGWLYRRDNKELQALRRRIDDALRRQGLVP